MPHDRRKPRPRGGAAQPFPVNDDRAPTAYLHRLAARPQQGAGRSRHRRSSGAGHGRPAQTNHSPSARYSRDDHRHPQGARPQPAPAQGAAPLAAPRPEPATRVNGIDPFALFCAYHLGITEQKRYAPANIHDVARRFRVDASIIKQALQAYDMDPDALLNTEFDLTMAQLDIQVAPEGVDRVELARTIYEEFRRAPRKARDWKRVLEEDARENARIFGKR